MISWWIETSGTQLSQGEIVKNCRLPVFSEVEERVNTTFFDEADLIIVSHSCDLANNKAPFVILCRVMTLTEFETKNPSIKSKWDEINKGRQPALHLLASPVKSENNRAALVIDFRQIFSLPVEYLQKHANALGTRYRLISPFLEQFSQAFGRYFMRVGLPTGTEIRAFK